MLNKGFTLLEVLVSLFVLISSVVIFSSIQLRSVLRVAKDKEYLDRVFIVKNAQLNFIEAQSKNNKKTLRVDIENPFMSVTSQIIDIDKKSSLKNFIDDIKIVKTIGTWKSFSSSYDLPFVTFMKIEGKK